jgi:hypothetical protein
MVSMGGLLLVVGWLGMRGGLARWWLSGVAAPVREPGDVGYGGGADGG